MSYHSRAPTVSAQRVTWSPWRWRSSAKGHRPIAVLEMDGQSGLAFLSLSSPQGPPIHLRHTLINSNLCASALSTTFDRCSRTVFCQPIWQSGHVSRTAKLHHTAYSASHLDENAHRNEPPISKANVLPANIKWFKS